jgi:3-phenylpropionate/trans-cinnamate dioxygenase ferredoxin subunit
MSKHRVAKIADLPPGERKIVTINNREIGILNVDGNLYALRNICPHRLGPLCKGRVRPLVVWEGEEVYNGQSLKLGSTNIGHERENEIIKCPWHNWEFDLKTGKSITDDDLRVRTYRVEAEDDDIVLYLR